MLLTIDAGNTNTVFAMYDDGGTLRGMWRCRTDRGRTADEYLVFVSQHCELVQLDMRAIHDVMICSVVPDADFELRQFCERGLGCDPIFITSDHLTGRGLRIIVDKHTEVGTDRLVNAWAVLEHYRAPAIVVDFGTATTFDVVDADGTFCGGVIAPGINLSLQALHLAAAKLPRVTVAQPPHAIGRNTVEAMQSGVFWGYVGLTTTILDKITSELGQSPVVIGTGGLATLFKDHVPQISVIDEELTIKGLLSIYRATKTH